MIRKKSGFTLVELLVVVAIIGLLAGLVTANVGSARAKARDAARQADLRSMQTAIELAVASTGILPGLTNNGTGGGGTTFLSNANNVNQNQWIPSLAPNYLARVPTDPRNDSIYFYRYVTGSGNQLGAYYLEARLEVAAEKPTLTTPPSDDPTLTGSFVSGISVRQAASYFRVSGGPVQ